MVLRHRLPGEELEAAISIAMAVLIGAGATSMVYLGGGF
jgi:hypothetical protein